MNNKLSKIWFDSIQWLEDENKTKIETSFQKKNNIEFIDKQYKDNFARNRNDIDCRCSSYCIWDN